MGHRSYNHNPDGTISLRRVSTVNKESAEKVAAVEVVPQCQAISVMNDGEYDTNEVKQNDVTNQREVQSDEQCKKNVNSEGMVRLKCSCKIPIIAAITESQNMMCENSDASERYRSQSLFSKMIIG